MPIEITETQNNEYRAYTQYGTPEQVAAMKKENDTLKGENATLREDRRQLKQKVPGEGAVVLAPGDEVKKWEAFQALGKTPEELVQGAVLTADEKKEYEATKETLQALDLKATDIPKIVEERNSLKGKDAQRTRVDGIAQLAKAEGLPEDTIPTLSAIMLTLDPNAVFEVKTEKEKDAGGTEVEKQVGYVTLAGKQPMKFSEYRATTAEMKGIRTSGGTESKDDGNRWVDTPVGGATGGYDAAKVGREMAERQKAHAGGATNAALT
jgi:hypothetical protein